MHERFLSIFECFSDIRATELTLDCALQHNNNYTSGPSEH